MNSEKSFNITQLKIIKSEQFQTKLIENNDKVIEKNNWISYKLKQSLISRSILYDTKNY